MMLRRNALGLGLAASAVALSGRGSARAADALSIGPNGVNIENLQVKKSLTVAGNAELKTPAGANTLDVQSAVRVNEANHPKGLALYVTATGNGADSLAEFRHSNGTQGIGFGHNTIYATGSNPDQDLALKARGKSPVTIQSNLSVQKSLTIAGNAELKTPSGANTLDVQSAVRVNEANHPKGLALYVTATGSGADSLAEFRDSNGSQGIGIGYNTIYATGSNANQDLILKARGTGRVKIAGTLEAKDFAADANPLRNRMYPEAPIVYQDIFDALNARAIEKIGNPSYDDTSHRESPWNDRHMIRFGGNNEANGNGAKVTIPAGYDTVWVRVLGDRWNGILTYFTDGYQLGSWTGGRRSANSYAPDGTLADSYAVQHQWVPIPARRPGQLALISKPNTSDNFWISGLAFSKNPWGHATQSAIGYRWAVNGGDATGWQNDDFGKDSTGKIDPKTKLVLKVPVVPSGRDKLLYLIEHNSDWNGAMHTGISVGGRPIERFMATYDNPFSRHWNSKSYERYIATRIPKDYIPADARHLDVIIDMTKQDKEMNFREIGTHDLAVPWP